MSKMWHLPSKESTEPTVAASTAFLEAAQTLGETMPQISLAEAHEHARKAMESTASILAESNKGYTQSTELLQETLNGFQAMQAQTMATVQENLEQYTSTALQSAAKAIQDSTEPFRNPGQSATEFLREAGHSSVHFKMNRVKAYHSGKWLRTPRRGGPQHSAEHNRHVQCGIRTEGKH